jgi:tRNA(His) guanylyltransferase
MIMRDTDPLAHINNLQNTAFWALVKSGQSTKEANKTVQASLSTCIPSDVSADQQGTDAKAKNELLYSQFGINYNTLPPRFRKGSIVIRTDPASNEESLDSQAEETEQQERRPRKTKVKRYEGTIGELVVVHEDLIRDAFWSERPWLLE